MACELKDGNWLDGVFGAVNFKIFFEDRAVKLFIEGVWWLVRWAL